jgi:addiction module HigA family antidote
MSKGKKIANDMIPGDIFHPGEQIRDELEARGMSQQELANKMGVSKSEVSQLINAHRNISALAAVLLEKALGIDAEFWMNLQVRYDIDVVKKKMQQSIKSAKISNTKKAQLGRTIAAA